MLLAKVFIELLRSAICWSKAQSMLTFSCKVAAKRVIISLHTQGPTLSERPKAEFFQVPTRDGIELRA